MVMATTVAVQFTNTSRAGCRASLPLRCPRLAAWPLTTAAILFVANTTFDSGSQTFQATIVKITPGGVQSTFATLSGNLFGEDVAFDSSGNLFVIAQDQNDPNQASTIYKFTPRGVQSTFGSVPGQGFGLAFDGAGNLFAAVNDAVDPSEHLEVYSRRHKECLRYSINRSCPARGALAFDRFGNLFVSTESEPRGAGYDPQIYAGWCKATLPRTSLILEDWRLTEAVISLSRSSFEPPMRF